jgi:hypothetical protein
MWNGNWIAVVWTPVDGQSLGPKELGLQCEDGVRRFFNRCHSNDVSHEVSGCGPSCT